MDSTVVSIILLGFVAVLVYYIFYKKGHQTTTPRVTGKGARPPPLADVTYAPETNATLMGHTTLNWDLPVQGLYAPPYQPITFRPPNPGGALDNYGVQNYVMWDLSKSGGDCGPEIDNPPFYQTHNLCWYTRQWTEPTSPQV